MKGWLNILLDKRQGINENLTNIVGIYEEWPNLHSIQDRRKKGAVVHALLIISTANVKISIKTLTNRFARFKHIKTQTIETIRHKQNGFD